MAGHLNPLAAKQQLLLGKTVKWIWLRIMRFTLPPTIEAGAIRRSATTSSIVLSIVSTPLCKP